MAGPLEIGLLVVVLAALVAVYVVWRIVKPLVVNAVVGVAVLLVAGFLGFGAQITPVVVLIVALGGLPAAILVILLAQAGVLFAPAALLALAL